MKKLLFAGVAMFAFTNYATAADCPHVTLADSMGVAGGAYPQQYEKAEFEAAGGCTMTFQGNPDSAALNAKIRGNGELPALSERIPAEPLVVAPYSAIGSYGGTLDVLSMRA